ncbi:hypothetical protein [uncultured Campylobacter sp.]|uniref:hypothetical protein n=1 Tax=uncultured Campylobacter sp. TaxID=218934 RepID=UPI0026341468|nr:hypothetical protein [uncultured Campylobacter sp.]
MLRYPGFLDPRHLDMVSLKIIKTAQYLYRVRKFHMCMLHPHIIHEHYICRDSARCMPKKHIDREQ